MDEATEKALRKKYYNPKYAQSYYQKNKDKIIKASKSRWANMTDEEKQAYYQERKAKRKEGK